MPHSRRKTVIMRLTAIALALLSAFIVILYARGVFDFTFIDRPDPPAYTAEDDAPAPPEDGVSDVDYVVPNTVENDDGTVSFPDYDSAAAGLAADVDYAGRGYTLYKGLYSGDDCALVRVSAFEAPTQDYALRDAATRTVTRTEKPNGSYSYAEGGETSPRPVLEPYYGYIVCDNGTTLELRDSSGNRLMGDITAFVPTGYRTLAGDPLFKSGDDYYYYYDGANLREGTVVVDRVTADDYLAYTDPAPAACADVDPATDVTPTLPEGAGMVLCTVDQSYFNTLRLNSSYESAPADTGLYRICVHRVERTVVNQAEIDKRNAEIAAWRAAAAGGTTKANRPVTGEEPQPIEPVYQDKEAVDLWGYIDASGNYLLEPRYKAAYDFASNGVAVVLDPDGEAQGRMIALNKTGGTAFNAYRSIIYIVERANTPVRDGHYMPDTFGIENDGMLEFRYGLLRVRRRMIDTANGSVTVKETDALVNAGGKIFNLPGGYELVAYSDGVALLEKDGRYGYMSCTGRWIVQPKYTYARPFSEGLAVVGYKDSAVCMIDTSGNVVLPMVYNHISDCSDGVVVAYSQGHGWSLFNKISTRRYEEKVNPILALKKRLVAENAYKQAQEAQAQTEPAQQ